MTLLKVDDLSVRLSGLSILHDVNISVDQGDLVTVIGSNGAGKSTLLKTISGLVHQEKGHIEFDGKDMSEYSADKRALAGLTAVPEGKQLYYHMTVVENLKMGGYKYRKDKAKIERNIQNIFEIFPILGEHRDRIAGTFSGGEQQMLTIARGLMSEPKLLMIDELSLGLAPKVIAMLMDIVKELNQDGMSILIVEQNINAVLKIADKGYVIENGTIVMEGTGEELRNSEHIKDAYLGL
jgi:branched-chain amino acid transport system ATP-binding protein